MQEPRGCSCSGFLIVCLLLVAVYMWGKHDGTVDTLHNVETCHVIIDARSVHQQCGVR